MVKKIKNKKPRLKNIYYYAKNFGLCIDSYCLPK